METKVLYAGTLQDAIDFLNRFEDAHTRRSKALLSVATREAETIPPDGYSRSWRLASISGGGTLYNQGLVSLAQHNADSTVIQVTGEDSEQCQRYADGLLDFLDSERQSLSLQPAGAVIGNGIVGDGQAEPTLPKRPGKGASREDWYRYKYDCDRGSTIKFTHAQLAEALSLADGTARNYYSVWLAEHGETHDTMTETGDTK